MGDGTDWTGDLLGNLGGMVILSALRRVCVGLLFISLFRCISDSLFIRLSELIFSLKVAYCLG